MTIIAAVKHDNTIYMGADVIATAGGGAKAHITQGKIVVRNNMVMGVSGVAWWLSVLRSDPAFPRFNNTTDFEWWLNSDLNSYLRQVATDRGVGRTDSDGDFYVDLNIIVGWQGQLYLISTDLMAIQIGGRDYAASGAGRDEALGSLYSTQMFLKDYPQRRVEMALNAAAEMRPTIQGPFMFEVLKSGDVSDGGKVRRARAAKLN